jgi:SAM-dependent methyltransferase
MTGPSVRRDSNAADGYQDLLVPALMEEWAPRVADAAGIRAGDRVLDVACGTGVLTREVARRAGAGGSVTGLDLSPEMLAVAARLSPSLRWQQGSGDALAFPDQSFDAVVSQFGLMFFTDRRQALREMNRVLRFGGRLAVAVWNALDDNPAYASAVALLEKMAGRAAADALRAPFVLGQRAEFEALFAEAGVTAVDIETRARPADFPSIRTMVEADLRGWLPLMGVSLPDDRIEHILQEAERALATYRTADNRMVFPVSAHIVIATKR